MTHSRRFPLNMHRWNISSCFFFTLKLLAGYFVLVIILWHQRATVLRPLYSRKAIDKKDIHASRTTEKSPMTQSQHYQSRLDLLKMMCKDHKTRRDVVQHPTEFLVVDEKHKLIYCNVPKVGCTSWKRLFLTIAGVNVSDPNLAINRIGREYLHYVHKYNATRRRYVLKNYKKFVFVRHPFTRLLSAYQDKLSPRSRYGTTENSNSFTRIALRIIHQLHGQDAEQLVRNNMSLYNLRFADFIHYLVDPRTKVYDRHWERFHELCLPCDIKYDFVGMFETFDEDVEHILNVAGINVSFPESQNATHSSVMNTVERYYKTVSPIDLKKLYYDRFFFDFKLFGYSPITFTGTRNVLQSPESVQLL